MVNDFLFELGTEELPSGAVYRLAEALAQQLTARLQKALVPHGSVQFFASPRRLAVRIKEVNVQQQEQTISRRGPALAGSQTQNGQPTQALIGFAKSCGVSIDVLKTVETDKGAWWYYESSSKGELTRDLLPKIIEEALAMLPIAKPMRWGKGEVEFVRPVHWAVLLFGAEAISCQILGVTTTRNSYGHRFHHPQAVEITSPEAYESILKQAYVVADFVKRRTLIKEQIQQLAAEKHYQAIMPDALIDEVTAIVEWPVSMVVGFDDAFLEVPPQALIASMQSHQKCFALQDDEARLVPYFITVSNIDSLAPHSVILGNERVMRARLSDAVFFYQKDRQTPLHHYREKTGEVIFQAKLGTLLDKSERLCQLMRYMSGPFQCTEAEALRAAFLSKCDLLTGMVGEFPELQGLMGYYYARHDGESEAVAVALNEQYMPRFAADDLPISVLGCALSLADRMDTLVGAFAIGQRPTGVKDPFKLRRQALAVIRILIEKPEAPTLSSLIEQACLGYGALLQPAPDSMTALRLFILERLYAFYEMQGVSADVVQAVRARQEENLFDLDKRIKALQVFLVGENAISLSAACKRVNHLLQHMTLDCHSPVEAALFQEPAERDLYQRLQGLGEQIAPFYAQHDYVSALTQLASLREPIDRFFDKVMVMVEDPALRINRLQLLAQLQSLLQGVADISLLS
jgi:glycyl-tRNA synthetase beta chain